jgi:hypothetical protein
VCLRGAVHGQQGQVVYVLLQGKQGHSTDSAQSHKEHSCNAKPAHTAALMCVCSCSAIRCADAGAGAGVTHQWHINVLADLWDSSNSSSSSSGIGGATSNSEAILQYFAAVLPQLSQMSLYTLPCRRAHWGCAAGDPQCQSCCCRAWATPIPPTPWGLLQSPAPAHHQSSWGRRTGCASNAPQAVQPAHAAAGPGHGRHAWAQEGRGVTGHRNM